MSSTTSVSTLMHQRGQLASQPRGLPNSHSPVLPHVCPQAAQLRVLSPGLSPRPHPEETGNERQCLEPHSRWEEGWTGRGPPPRPSLKALLPLGNVSEGGMGVARAPSPGHGARERKVPSLQQFGQNNEEKRNWEEKARQNPTSKSASWRWSYWKIISSFKSHITPGLNSHSEYSKKK